MHKYSSIAFSDILPITSVFGRERYIHGAPVFKRLPTNRKRDEFEGGGGGNARPSSSAEIAVDTSRLPFDGIFRSCQLNLASSTSPSKPRVFGSDSGKIEPAAFD